jgi:hypothetical protein
MEKFAAQSTKANVASAARSNEFGAEQDEVRPGLRTRVT